MGAPAETTGTPLCRAGRAIAARLARTKLIRLLDDQLIYKPPTGIKGESVVGWHADKAYWSNSSSNSLLTAGSRSMIVTRRLVRWLWWMAATSGRASRTCVSSETRM